MFRHWVQLPKPQSPDFLASVSVALLLIPQSMAYAEIAGLPLIAGLYASILPLIFSAPFGSSPFLQTGPVALTSLLTLAALQSAGAESSDANYVKLAALLALVVAVVRLIMGLAHLGWLVYFVSEPVMQGFTSAAAVIIISSQLPKTFGHDGLDGSTLANSWNSLTNPESWHLASLVLGFITLCIMLGGRRLHQLFPGVALAVVAGIAYAKLFGGSVTTVGELYDIPEGFMALSFNLPWGATGSLLFGGVIIAVIGFSEPASISRIFARAENQEWDADRELVSSAAANFGAAISGGYPVGGSFSRSSLNYLAGARTVWSRVFVGVIVAAFLPFVSLLNDLPSPVLGAVVIGAVLGLLKLRTLFNIWNYSRLEAGLAWATFAFTLVLAPNIQWAILAGIILSAAYHVGMPLKVQVVKEGGSVRIVPQGLIWVASKNRLVSKLENVVSDHAKQDIIIDFSSYFLLDAEVHREVEALAASHSASNRSVTLRHKAK